MQTEWYVRRATGVLGPYSSAQLKQFAHDGRIQQWDLISRDGQKWIAASEVRTLEFGASSSKPLPMPVKPLISQPATTQLEAPIRNSTHAPTEPAATLAAHQPMIRATSSLTAFKKPAALLAAGLILFVAIAYFGIRLTSHAFLVQRVSSDLVDLERGLSASRTSLDYLREHSEARRSDWKQAAQKGVPAGLYLWGRCLQEGVAVPQDEYEAFQLIKRAAESGLPIAEENVGYCYAEGRGVPKNSEESFRWTLRAAEKGALNAQRNVAIAYRDGRTRSAKNIQEAITWFTKAADGGLSTAAASLAELYQSGTGDAEHDLENAARWHRRAAEANVSSSQAALGEFYQYGWGGLKKDSDKAAEWYRKAAGQMNGMAQAHLAQMYALGLDVKPNLSLAGGFARMANDNPEYRTSKRPRFVSDVLATVAVERARLLRANSEHSAAVPLLREALVIYEQLHSERTWDVWTRHRLALAMFDLADSLFKTGDADDAVRMVIKASDLKLQAATKRLSEMFDTGDHVTKSAAEQKRYADLASRQNARFLTVKCIVRGNGATYQLPILLHDEVSGSEPLEYETRRIREDFGAEVADSAKDVFNKMYEISKKNGVSFVELTLYALEQAKSPTEKNSKPSSSAQPK